MILVFILGFCVMFHLLAHYFKPYSRLKMLKDAKRILIITSHPDDETMFFGPTILSLCRGKSNFQSKNLFLLCMSTGDHKSIGTKRKLELYEACKILGIPEENITILRYIVLWIILVSNHVTDSETLSKILIWIPPLIIQLCRFFPDLIKTQKAYPDVIGKRIIVYITWKILKLRLTRKTSKYYMW